MSSLNVNDGVAPVFVVEGDSIHIDVEWVPTNSSEIQTLVVSGIEHAEGTISVGFELRHIKSSGMSRRQVR